MTLLRLQFFVRYRWLLIALPVLGASIGLTIGILSRPVYRGEVKVVPVEETNPTDLLGDSLGSLGGFANLVGVGIGNSRNNKDVALEVIRSRLLLHEYINENGLMTPLLEELDRRSLFGLRSAELGDDHFYYVRRLFLEDVLKINEDRRTGIITIAIEWYQPRTAARWANELVATLNAEMRSRARSDAQRNLSYLNARLEKTDAVYLRDALYRLVEREVESEMFAEVREEFVLKVIDPAVAPDELDYVRPRRALLVMGGLAVGILLALAISVLREEGCRSATAYRE